MKKIISRFFLSGFFIDILLLIILSLIPLLWFRPGAIMVGHDNVFPLNPPEFFRDRFFSWSENHGLGFDQSSGMGSILIHGIDILPSLFGASLQMMQKIVYCFWFFMLLSSAYVLGFFLKKWELFPNRFLRLLLPIWYAINFYVLQGWWIGERTKFSAMVNLPLFLTLLIGITYKKISPIWAAIMAAVILTVFNGGGMRGIPLFGGAALGIVVTVVYFSFFAVIEKELAVIKRFLQFFIVFLPLLVLLNAYMLFPFLSHTLQSYKAEITRVGGAANTLSWDNVISKDASIMNLLRFEGIPEWYTSLDHPYGQLFLRQRKLVVASFAFPILIILSFFVLRKRRERRIFYLFVFLFLVSLIFSMGTHFPTGELYKFLVSHVPGFAIFRSPLYKFGYAYWLAGGFLVVTSVSWMLSFLERLQGKKGKFLVVFVLGFFLFGYLKYHFPYLTGDIFRWSSDRLETRVIIPQYVIDTATWIHTQHTSSRTLLLPEANSNWLGDVYRWKFYSLYPLTADISRDPFLYNNDSLTENERAYLLTLYKAIQANDTSRVQFLANKLNIAFFVVRDDFYSDLSWMPTTSPEIYEKALASSEAFKEVRRFGQWHIFQLQNPSAPGVIYSTGTISRVDSDMQSVTPYSEIDSLTKEQAASNYFSTTYVGKSSALVAQVPENRIQSDITISNCLNCSALSNQVEILFPEIFVLPSSPFYPLVESKRVEPIFFSVQQKIDYLLGMSLLRSREFVAMKQDEYTPSQKKRVADPVAQTASKLSILYSQLYETLYNLPVDDELWITNSLKVQQYLTAEKESLVGDAKIWLQSTDFSENGAQVMHDLNKLLVLISGRVEDGRVYDQAYFSAPSKNVDRAELWLGGDNRVDLLGSGSSQESMIYPNALQSTNVVSAVAIPFHQPEYQVTYRLSVTHPLDSLTDQCIGTVVSDVKNGDVFRAEAALMNRTLEKKYIRLVVFPLTSSASQISLPTIVDSGVYESKPLSQTSLLKVVTTASDYERLFIGVCSPFLFDDADQVLTDFHIHMIQSPMLLTLTKSSVKTASENPPKLEVQRINQTKYLLTVYDATPGFFLNLQESFMSDWKLYYLPSVVTVKDTTIGDTIWEKYFFSTWFKKPLDEKFHFEGNGYFNTWYINKGGTYSLILEYKPQRLFYEGIIVSIFGVIILLGCTLFLLGRVRDRK